MLNGNVLKVSDQGKDFVFSLQALYAGKIYVFKIVPHLNNDLAPPKVTPHRTSKL